MPERSDREADDIRPDLPTWVEIIADLRADLNVLSERVGQLERERPT